MQILYHPYEISSIVYKILVLIVPVKWYRDNIDYHNYYRRFPKISTEFYYFGFCLAKQLGTNYSLVKFL